MDASQLLSTHMVLPDRRVFARTLLLPRPSLPPLVLALRQRPRRAGRRRRRPARQWHQLRVMCLHWFFLPMVHEALPLPLVGTIQLSSLYGARRWRHHRPHRHILRPAIAERRYPAQLVGQFGVAEHGGHELVSSEDGRSGRNIWTKFMVMIIRYTTPDSRTARMIMIFWQRD